MCFFRRLIIGVCAHAHTPSGLNYDASWHGIRAQETWIFSSTSNLATLKLHYSCLMGDVDLSMNFKATDTTLRSVAVNDSRVWVGVIHPERKTRGRTVASCPQKAGTLPQESISHIRGEHPVGSTQPRPFATLINKNIIPVVTDFWRSAKLLANLLTNDLLIRSLIVGMTTFFGILLLSFVPSVLRCLIHFPSLFFCILFFFLFY
jgi:hypothetical protein